MIGPPAIDGLRAVLAAAIEDASLAVLGGRPVALGWATVDLDRAAPELRSVLDLAAEAFVVAAATASLGARCRIALDVLGPGVALVLLEPSTEGRLAASLARNGEGPAAVWLEVASLPDAEARLRRAGVALSLPGRGPLGLERVLIDRPVGGPDRLVVERAGTIRA